VLFEGGIRVIEERLGSEYVFLASKCRRYAEMVLLKEPVQKDKAKLYLLRAVQYYEKLGNAKSIRLRKMI
jgi:hypothetical protein